MSTADTGQSNSFSQNSDISITPSLQESNKLLRSLYTTSTRSACVNSVNNVTNHTSRKLRALNTRLPSSGGLDSSLPDPNKIICPNSAPPRSPPLLPQGTGGNQTPKGLPILLPTVPINTRMPDLANTAFSQISSIGFMELTYTSPTLSQAHPSFSQVSSNYAMGLMYMSPNLTQASLVSNQTLGLDAIMAADEVERAFVALLHPQSCASSRASFHSANAIPLSRSAPIDGRNGTLPDDDPAKHLKQTLINAAYQYNNKASPAKNTDEMADRLILGISTIFNFFTAQQAKLEKCTKFSGILSNALHKILSHIKVYKDACANNFEHRSQNGLGMSQDHHSYTPHPGTAWGDVFPDNKSYAHNPITHELLPQPQPTSNSSPPTNNDSQIESMLNSILDRMNKHDKELQEIRRLCKPTKPKPANPNPNSAQAKVL